MKPAPPVCAWGVRAGWLHVFDVSCAGSIILVSTPTQQKENHNIVHCFQDSRVCDVHHTVTGLACTDGRGGGYCHPTLQRSLAERHAHTTPSFTRAAVPKKRRRGGLWEDGGEWVRQAVGQGAGQ